MIYLYIFVPRWGIKNHKKRNMKNKDLYNYHLQLEQLKSNVIYQLLRGRVQEFYRHNGLRLNTLTEKLQKLQDDFFVIINNNIQYTKEVIDGEETGKDTPVMQDGKLFSDYTEKYNEIMEKDCQINF